MLVGPVHTHKDQLISSNMPCLGGSPNPCKPCRHRRCHQRNMHPEARTLSYIGTHKKRNKKQTSNIPRWHLSRSAHQAHKPVTPMKLGIIVVVSHLHVFSIPSSTAPHSLSPDCLWRPCGCARCAVVPSRLGGCCHARCGGSVARGGEDGRMFGESGNGWEW